MTDREAAFHWRCEDAHVNDAPPATRAHAGQDRCHLEPVDGAVDGRHKVRDPDAPESAVRFAGTVAGERGVAALRDGPRASYARRRTHCGARHTARQPWRSPESSRPMKPPQPNSARFAP